MFAEIGLASTCQVTAKFLKVQESLLHMMVEGVVVSLRLLSQIWQRCSQPSPS